MKDTWAVTVERNGERVVTLETECLAGRDLQPGDDEAIRTAAHHLLAFIGDPAPPDKHLPHLARQFDLMAKGCRSMGLESLEGDYDALRQDANAGKIDAAPIVEAIDYDYRNGHDGKAAAELLIGALLKDALHA